MTRSAKTEHNRASLNLQYKALNTLDACLHIVAKILEHLFLSERRA